MYESMSGCRHVELGLCSGFSIFALILTLNVRRAIPRLKLGLLIVQAQTHFTGTTISLFTPSRRSFQMPVVSTCSRIAESNLRTLSNAVTAGSLKQCEVISFLASSLLSVAGR